MIINRFERFRIQKFGVNWSLNAFSVAIQSTHSISGSRSLTLTLSLSVFLSFLFYFVKNCLKQNHNNNVLSVLLLLFCGKRKIIIFIKCYYQWSLFFLYICLFFCCVYTFLFTLVTIFFALCIFLRCTLYMMNIFSLSSVNCCECVCLIVLICFILFTFNETFVC